MRSEFISNDFQTLNRLATSEASEEVTCQAAIGSSRADFHAKIFPSLVKELGWLVSDQDSGMNTLALLASYDRDTRSWRTSELYLFEDLTPSWDRLPKSGTMRNGKIYAPQMSARPTEESGSGLWRTPAAHDPGVSAGRLRPIDGGELGGMNRHYDKQTGRMAQIGLTQQVQLRETFPTPRANDAEKRGDFDATNPRNGLPAAVKMFPTPRSSDADRGGRGDLIQAVRGNSNKHFKTYPTPSASMMTIQDMEQARFAGNDPNRPKYRDVWPTPTVACATGGQISRGGKRKGELLLAGAVKMWPTPRTAGMCGGTGNWNQLKDKCADIDEARKMGAGNGGQLNPTWVEWILGYPLHWTEIVDNEQVATKKIRADGDPEDEQAQDLRLDLSTDPMERKRIEAVAWETEPDIGRVAIGVPNRVNRLKCLGNSIVPQIAELIFTQINRLIHE